VAREAVKQPANRDKPVEGKAVVPAPLGLQMADIDAALDDLGETFDISREDLALLLAQAELHAAARGSLKA
jgi:CBS domain-containing membrane protein